MHMVRQLLAPKLISKAWQPMRSVPANGNGATHRKLLHSRVPKIVRLDRSNRPHIGYKQHRLRSHGHSHTSNINSRK